MQAVSYVDQVTMWLNDQTCDGAAKRRRKVSRRQRVAANDRERRRMRQLNAAFDRLRQQIPTPSPRTSASAAVGDRSHRPLSRIQTLRLAIEYIAFMMNTLDRLAIRLCHSIVSCFTASQQSLTDSQSLVTTGMKGTPTHLGEQWNFGTQIAS